MGNREISRQIDINRGKQRQSGEMEKIENDRSKGDKERKWRQIEKIEKIDQSRKRRKCRKIEQNSENRQKQGRVGKYRIQTNVASNSENAEMPNSRTKSTQRKGENGDRQKLTK